MSWNEVRGSWILAKNEEDFDDDVDVLHVCGALTAVHMRVDERRVERNHDCDVEHADYQEPVPQEPERPIVHEQAPRRW